jgi:hypothetical protein
MADVLGNTVIGLQGHPLAPAAPSDGSVMTWEAGPNRWASAAPSDILSQTGGVTVGAATGGKQGTGTLNAQALFVQGLAVAGGHGTVTAVAGAATLNAGAGVVTTEALVAATTYTLTLTSDFIVGSTSVVFAIASNATGGVPPPTVTSIAEGSGTVVIVFAMSALTGTFKIRFAIFN